MPTTNPYLTVIIPAYNCSGTIERLMDSIVANGFSKDELEVIVCDDKSTDNFLSLVTFNKNSIALLVSTFTS